MCACKQVNMTKLDAFKQVITMTIDAWKQVMMINVLIGMETGEQMMSELLMHSAVMLYELHLPNVMLANR